MTTSNAHSTTECTRHEQLVAGTLALLPARRKGLEHLRANRTRTRLKQTRTYLPPADEASHRELLTVIGEALEGSLVSADSRASILSEARKLGVRPFDASLMIALAQDRARRGESLDGIPAIVSCGPRALRTKSGSAAATPWLAIWLAVAASGVLVAHYAASWMMG